MHAEGVGPTKIARPLKIGTRISLSRADPLIVRMEAQPRRRGLRRCVRAPSLRRVSAEPGVTRSSAGAWNEAIHLPPFLILNGTQDRLSRRIAVIKYNPIIRNA